MRRITRTATMAAALALAAAPLAAQGGPGRGPAQGRGFMAGGPGAMARNPVQVVLDHRAQLELTAEQVATLESLRDRVQAENAPRWHQLQEAWGDVDPRALSVEERQELRQRMQELAPVRDQIRTTNRAAMDQVHELMTAEQESQLHGIMRRGNRGADGRGMRARGARRGGCC
ncbi:MAG: hypothetical protein GWM90_14750 [Gemmatimonadetes bacterium]|nr:hypothetical protein [Gemmatimonadota bacterium]NIQ55438.1 hypothetical protein [Gemmatimonadota bacterium]NIU75646.1 hypothetical protein [Gammaproteobacteria bacterium]NIX45321.1 hypothetical protein [Gemmatimonadota bacterium]NIY09604.1 hypothetical protein [Gemmatimonadota bacterium]